MKKINFIIFCSILNLISLFPFTKDFQIRFFLSGFLFFVIGTFLLKKNPFLNKIKGIFMIYMPFILINFFVSLENAINTRTYAGLPLFFIGCLSFLISVFIYRKKNKVIIVLTSTYIIILLITTIYLKNYYNYIIHEENPITNTTLPNINLYDEKGNLIKKELFLGKITILDVWDSRCSNCIKGFPKFEKLKKEFSKEKEIQFFSINMPSKGDNRDNVSRFTKSFNFNKMYSDQNFKNEFKINGVPQYIIIDKNLKVIYIGDLILNKFEFYNNFYTIIDKLKQ